MTRELGDMDPNDELTSAYLDGEVTAEERARVEASPEMLARVERLAAARDLLAQDPAPLRAAMVDAQIERALDDAPRATGPARRAAPSNVVPLRRRLLTYGGPVAAAAAVVALFLSMSGMEASSQFSSVGASIQGSTGGYALGGDSGAEVATDQDEPLAPTEGDPTSAPVPGLTAGPERFDRAVVDEGVPFDALGTTADDEALRNAVDEQLSADGRVRADEYTGVPLSSTSTTVPRARACSAQEQHAALLGTRLVLAILEVGGMQQVAAYGATVAGEPVTVVLFARDAEQPVRATVVVPGDGCTIARFL